MLLVLPLRGWAGNVMAVDTAVGAAAASSAQAFSGNYAQAPAQLPDGLLDESLAKPLNQQSMLDDCGMNMQAPGDGEAPVCSSCDTCELCLSVVDPKPMAWLGNHSMRHVSPTAVDAAFSSAAQAFSLKPPIS